MPTINDFREYLDKIFPTEIEQLNSAAVIIIILLCAAVLGNLTPVSVEPQRDRRLRPGPRVLVAGIVAAALILTILRPLK